MSERTYWVIREGKVKGEGRYMGHGIGADWRMTREDAIKFGCPAQNCVEEFGGRIVKVTVRKNQQPLVESINSQVRINGAYILDADLCIQPSAEEIVGRIREALGQ